MKIVWFCIPAHGHTNPTLGLVKEISEGFKRCGGVKAAREFLEGLC
ncbi:MAG: hypothetical protein PUA75_06795 [Clostridiales bacterium]|nr:hypothetical protein [Clostridiales bacterium]